MTSAVFLRFGLGDDVEAGEEEDEGLGLLAPGATMALATPVDTPGANSFMLISKSDARGQSVTLEAEEGRASVVSVIR